jgi:signal transduction histidine kinase
MRVRSVSPGRVLVALRPPLGDVLLVVVLVLSSVAGARLARQPWEPEAVALMAPLAWRRRFPVVVLAAEGVLVLAAGLAGGAIPPVVVLELILVIVVATYSAAAQGRRSRVALLLMLILAIGYSQVPVHARLPAWSAPPLILGCAWLAGDALRRRQERLTLAEERARRAEAEQDAVRREVLREERARIARELHDVVTHRVSVMVLQAGAARQVMDRRPARAAEALIAVEAGGREALNELRGLLGLLTQDNDDHAAAPLDPQPGLADLPSLIEHVRAAGLPVDTSVHGDGLVLPRGVDLAAYRIVQEALTNALKHSARIGTSLLLRYQPAAVDIEVTSHGSGPGHSGPVRPGRGLVGMRERAAVFGGTVEAGLRPEGAFTVRAHLPVSSPGEPAPAGHAHASPPEHATTATEAS